MKVLGISFGRKNQRSDVMVKEALFAAKAAGADVQFINTVRMDIGHCRACDYCSRMRDNGETEIHCCMKDDYHILEEACLEADGISLPHRYMQSESSDSSKTSLTVSDRLTTAQR